jgi:hypothetical protein
MRLSLVQQVATKGRYSTLFNVSRPSAQLGMARFPKFVAQTEIFEHYFLATGLEQFEGKLHIGTKRSKLR